MQLLCAIIGHRRSRRWARPYQDSWRSHCVRCGIRLQRKARRTWVELGQQEEEVAAE